ncbi:hypothetical protein HDU82_005381, partial [Entophlyctis luteolus]
MFESVISLVLNKFLGDYVSNLETSQLSIGVWQGDVALHNLKLKREALDKFNLPVDVVEGFLGELTLSIPWNDLKTRPVRVMIKNLFLLVAPKAEPDVDDDNLINEAERAHKAKMDKIEAAELIEKSAREARLPDEKQNASFIAQLVTKMVDNLQLSIQNIHIRYEDTNIHSDLMSMGITLSELSAFSTDENWNPAFIHDEVGIIHKLCRLESLAVYFNHSDVSLRGLNSMESKEVLNSIIAAENYVPEQNKYVLKPVSGLGKVKINKSPSTAIPQYHASMEFNEFGFVIEDRQYSSFLALARSFAMFIKSQKYRRFRPPRGVPPSADPIAWFKYAGTCVLFDIQEKRKKWRWDYFAERRDDRIRYIRLYKLSKSTVANEFKQEESEWLKILERKLSFDDIRLYRSIANNQLKKEKALRAVTPKPVSNEVTTLGWIASWWGSSESQDSSANEENTVLSDDQMKQLMDTIDYDPDAVVLRADIPKDMVQIRVEWCLRKGSLSLSKENMKGDFLSIVFDMLAATADILPTSVRGNVSLGGMTVKDGTTPGTQFETLIQAIQDKGVLSQGYEKQPFFSLEFEHNPLDERADEAITLKMLPLQVVINPASLNGVIDFFSVPSSDYDVSNALKSVAKGITAQTRMGLEFALNKHRTFDAKIDIAAPIFVLPERNSTVVVIDAGHLNVESKPVSKQIKREIEAKQGSRVSDADMEKLKSLMYDRFACVLTSVQVVIGPSLDSCLVEVSGASGNNHLHFLERTDIAFDVALSIVPQFQNHIRTIITGNLPRLHLNLSDRKYKSFMKILDIVSRRPEVETIVRPKTFYSTDSWTEQNDLIIDDDDDSFFDAEENVDRPSVEVPVEDPNRILMQFRFEIGQVSASLKKSNDIDPEKVSRTVADLKISGLNLLYNSKPHEYDVDIKIRSISIEDKSDPRIKTDRYLLTPTEANSDIRQDLLTIQYASRKPSSPNHNGVDQCAKISFASVDLNLVKESVLYLLDFALYTFTTVEASRLAEIQKNNGESLPIQQPAVSNTVMVVHVNFTSVNFFINQNDSKIATASFGALFLTITFKMGRMFVSGRLGNMSIVDDAVRDNISSVGSREMLKIEGSEVADFDYETFNVLLPDYPGYDSFLRFHAATAKLIFMEPLLKDLSNYFNEFFKLHMIMDAARKAVEYQEINGKMKYDLDVESPIIEFPDSVNQTGKRLFMYLGKILAKNEFSICEDRSLLNAVEAKILSMKLVSKFLTEESGRLDEIAEDVNIIVGCEFLKIADDSETLVPASQITVDVNSIKLKLSSDQYKFVLDVLDSVQKFLFPKKSNSPQDTSFESSAETSTEAPRILSDMLVKVPAITLEIFGLEVKQEYSIARFIISDLEYQTMSNSWNEGETEIHTKCLNIFDTRLEGGNLFREITPGLTRKQDQFSLKIKKEGMGRSHYVAAIDTLKLLLVIDHLDLMRKFFTAPFSEAKGANDTAEDVALLEGVYDFESLDKLKFRLNIVDVEIILLQDPQNRGTEAIILLGEELVVSYDLVTSLSTKNMGMFFCVMDNRKDSTLRFIQNFDLTLVMDSRLSGPGHQLNSINVDFSPLMLRVSFHDITLITDIFNKVMSLGGGKKNINSSTENIAVRPRVIMSREKIQVATQGIRVIIIDDLNDLQLPMYDFMIDKLFLEMRVDAGLKLHVNFFNVKNSHWEPFVEGFEFFLNVSREEEKLSVDIYSQKKLEVNISHVFVESTLNTLALLRRPQTRDRSLRTNSSAPYILKNETGYAMTLWIESAGDGLDTVLHEIKNHEEIPWRFDDWRVMRENVSPTPNKLSIQMHGQEWETLKGISVDGEGTKVYILRPSVNRIAHRLVCEVKMRKNIKVVTFRSTSVVQNATGIPIDVMVVNANRQVTHGPYTLAPGCDYCVPIEASYYDRIFVRPQESFGYNWSNDVLYWKDLAVDSLVIRKLLLYLVFVSDRASLISCSSLDRSVSPFVFQMNLSQPYEIVTASYPFLAITLLPPFQLENLLPYPFRYVVFDKNSRQEHRGLLEKGAIEPIHTVNPTHSLLLSIELVGVEFKPSEVVILSNADLSYRDETLTLKDFDEQELQLRIKYNDNLDHGGRKLINEISYSSFEPLRNRAMIKTPDSEWSKPISFEAVGSAFDLLIPLSNRSQDIHLGVKVNEGEGKYYLTKVVTFAPRFMVKNTMNEDLHCRQDIKQTPILVKSKTSMPIHQFNVKDPRQLCLRMAGLTDEWYFDHFHNVLIVFARSSPFSIDQVGRTFVKLSRLGSQDEDLIRAEVILEHATLFVILSREEGRWPIRIDNKSDIAIQFFQMNTKNKYLLVSGESRKYSWDNPSLPSKSIVLSVNGRERQIDLNKEVKEFVTVQLRLEGIGISVIDKSVKELLYASAKNIEFSYVDTSFAQSITFSINWLQIDNQRYGALEPIFLYPSVLPKEGQEIFHPVFMASLSKSKDSSYGVDYYNWFTILLQEISIDLDEDFLYALINFAKFDVAGWEKADIPMFDSMTIPEPQQSDSEVRMYFESFLVQPIQFNVSFQRTDIGTMDARFVLGIYMSDAPIRLNALQIYHPIITLSALVDLMVQFYSQEIVGQLHKIIGSADFLGNPVGLFNNVGSGVKDFFYEPMQGFEITRPQDFGIGVAKGTSSLVKKTVYGLSDTLSKFTGSVSKGLSVITLDEEYQQKRRLANARNRPKHAVYGVTAGVTAFGTSVASGLTGVLSKPVEGFAKDGAAGFFKGLGKGIVG